MPSLEGFLGSNAPKHGQLACLHLTDIADVEKEGIDGGRIWPAGKYVPQTRGDPENSLGPWSKENATIENEDIIVFLTLGLFACV